MLEQLIDQVKRRQAEYAHALAHGHASSFEAYQRLVGQIAGLEESLMIIDSLIREERDREF